jgi:hypothetical protein
MRIALLALIPMFALGTLVTACDDDTTPTTVKDMNVVTVHDMAMPTHDLAQPGD